jgi:hypothetical protein
VAPPSVLTTTDAPTATQNVEVAQSTDPSAPVVAGNVGAVQVAPPSEETSSWPT